MTAGRTGHRQTDTGRRHRDAFKSEQRASRTSGFDCPISHGIEAKEHCCKPITCFFPLTCHITHTLTHKHTHVCEWQNENLRLWVHPCWVTWCKTTGRTISALILPVSQTLSLHAPFSLSLSRLMIALSSGGWGGGESGIVRIYLHHFLLELEQYGMCLWASSYGHLIFSRVLQKINTREAVRITFMLALWSILQCLSMQKTHCNHRWCCSTMWFPGPVMWFRMVG